MPHVHHTLLTSLLLVQAFLGNWGIREVQAQPQAPPCLPSTVQQAIADLEHPQQSPDAAIEVLSTCGAIAIPDLMDTLTSTSDWEVQRRTIATLILIGEPAIDALLPLLAPGSAPDDVRWLAIEGLAAMGRTPRPMNGEIRDALTALTQDANERPRLRLAAALALEHIQVPPQHPWYQRVWTWIQRHPVLMTVSASSLGLSSLYLAVLGLNPRWLLWMPGQLTLPGTQIQLPSDFLLWLKYQPRVLDWWVREHWSEASQTFLSLPTVSDRDIHVPLQIELEGTSVDPLTADQLYPVFAQSPACVLIVGEGGVGKTSLACQIAKWGLGLMQDELPHTRPLCDHWMLPVLIEQELGETSLLQAIQYQLPRSQDENFVSEELLKALLRRRRVLVILDHISELTDQSYDRLQQVLNTTPINALILTTRLQEKSLGRVHYQLLEPQKLAGVKLPFFIQSYVEQRFRQTGQRNIFQEDYTELYRAATRLSSMMAATLQRATALLVRMYADQVIAVGGLKTAQLPDNIPQLMEEYVGWLNRMSAVDARLRRPTAAVQKDARIVAWECVKRNYRPSDARYGAVLEALKATVSNPDATGEAEAETRLDYLVRVLRLAQVSPGGTTVRIPLDPVAEYLAALQVTDYCQQADSEERWQGFLESVDAGITQPLLMRGFLLAVRNCCDRIPTLPTEVMEALTQRAQLNPEELRQAQLRFRINRLIDDLYDTNPKYLGQAIRNLRDEGDYAYRAVPDLIRVLESRRVIGELRIEAVDALMAICPEVAKLSPTFQALFTDDTEVAALRIRLGQALRELGALHQLLIVELQDDQRPTITLAEVPETAILDLPDGVTLSLVHIPAGTFWMGTAGDDASGNNRERPHHRVTVPEFWLGVYPVTQNQWAAVAKLPQVHTSLTAYPSHFAGVDCGRCPVDGITWEEAGEFCDRLTQFFQRQSTFRLPSEAEWEYACRAGTQTPFHFGDRLRNTLANYRSPHPTPAGKFQVANRFGLYDMHGNVHEWCQDVWHDTYAQAPNDARPWISGGDVTQRIIRGGAWLNGERLCRSAARDAANPSSRSDVIGLRVACSFLK